MPAVSTLVGWNPSGASCRRTKLFASSPAPIRSTNERAVSATTSARRRRRLPPPSPAPDDPSFRPDEGFAPEAWKAGASPKATAATTQAPRAKSRTVVSRRISDTRGRSAGSQALSPFNPAKARPTPRAPPETARRMPSARNCRSRRARLAPSAVRMATSRARPLARASRRLATLAQAMAKTRPTAPSSTSSAVRTPETRLSARGTISTPQPSFSFGYSRASAACTDASSACALAGVVPLFRRPTIRR